MLGTRPSKRPRPPIQQPNFSENSLMTWLCNSTCLSRIRPIGDDCECRASFSPVGSAQIGVKSKLTTVRREAPRINTEMSQLGQSDALRCNATVTAASAAVNSYRCAIPYLSIDHYRSGSETGGRPDSRPRLHRGTRCDE